RLQNFPTESSQELLHRLDPEQSGSLSMIEDMFATQFGKVERVNSTDGLRITFESGEIAHLRPSGNAPELRCYNEADTEERAKAMNRVCLKLLEKMR
ncbi:MAG: phosphomannomutase, partial [Gammaproteobacteria bacterium]|nr:phosphomannomutase [Gammaproteobacteria bacterium]